MKKAKFVISMLTLTPLMSGCSNSGDVFLRNADCFFGNDNKLVVSDVDKLTNLMKLNVKFLVYFHSDECGVCKRFEPIMNSFINKSNLLVVDIPQTEVKDVVREYGEYFFENLQPTFPYVGVVQGFSKVQRISNKDYMQTEFVFRRHINSLVNKSSIFYADDGVDFTKKVPQFSTISINKDDDNAMNLYYSKVQNKLYSTNKNVVIEYTTNDGLTLTSFDNEIKEKTQVNSSLESSIIDLYF